MKIGYRQIVPAIKTNEFFLRYQTLPAGYTQLGEKQAQYI
jgi:hypothetical protein